MFDLEGMKELQKEVGENAKTHGWGMEKREHLGSWWHCATVSSQRPWKSTEMAMHLLKPITERMESLKAFLLSLRML